MLKKKEVGQKGENAAAEYLISERFEIVARNYHSRFGEVDIIAQNEKYLLFVEVKTCTMGAKRLPREAVDTLKQKKLVKTAMIYLSEHEVALQPRFDVIEVWIEKESGAILTVNHIEHAFLGVDFYAFLRLSQNFIL